VYYQEPTWKPRAILPYDDAIDNRFWPASPVVPSHYVDPGFSESKLSPVPKPGVYPRVLITPTDVEKVRAKVALGNQAPIGFRVMWERVAKTQSPFFALVTNNDVLGRKLAAELVNKIKLLEPKLDAMDKRPDRDNLWNVERSIVADGDPDPPSEIWDLLQYDYLHHWMSAAERELARRVIARVVHRRISNFLHVPDHMMINNHEGFGMEYIRLMLLIEGLPGFDQKLFDASVVKTRAMLDWFLDKDGMCYESIKGWLNISAFVAVGLRDRNLLKHSHLQAKMRFFLAAMRWEDGVWHIRDEMRASAFHVIWMMHYFHPNDPAIDFLYQATFTTHPFLLNAAEKWPDPVGICQELLLLYAEEPALNKEGKVYDWNNQSQIDQLKLPLNWHDSTRGYIFARNSWRKEDLQLGFVCKQDFFYGGHEGSENNRITLWKDGINWIQDNNLLAAKATFLQNMLTVDGMGQRWPPAPGNWLGMKESKEGIVASGDGKIGYSYSKIMQVHPLDFPSGKTPYLAPFTEGNFDLSRDIQVAFQPSTIAYNHGYAHTDYGPWSGETRLVEGYKPFNPMQQAYRTVHLAKGSHPYVLIVDDAKKDSLVHHYAFNLSVPMDAELVEVTTPEVQFQQTDPSAVRMSDLILASRSTSRDSLTGKLVLKKGDPLCLIRVLWRNTNYGFPVPTLQKLQGYHIVSIPALSVSPEFRILVYPYKYGDALPVTTWNKQRTQLDVVFGSQRDSYYFGSTEGGRTALTMMRNGKAVLSSGAAPAQPTVLVRNQKYQPADERYTQKAKETPRYLFTDFIQVRFQRRDLSARIVYTLDGTEPTPQSMVYTKPLNINRDCVVKARVYDSTWMQGPVLSEIVTIQVEKAKASPAIQLPAGASKGLLARVYEINTKMYNDRGFFDANKIMMPNVNDYKPIHTSIVNGLTVPWVSPKAPMKDQSKGFYRFSGYFKAPVTGVYTFELNSCGPVTLDIGGKTVLESIGVFHQQQDRRSGEAVLTAGWHAFELVVCDPLFWNNNSLPPLPIELRMAMQDEAFKVVSADLFYSSNNPANGKSVASAQKRLEPVPTLPVLEPGAYLSVYDRTGLRREPTFLDVEGTKPYFSGKVNELEVSASRISVRVYDAYFFAPQSGLYQFEMPYREGDNAWLGSVQASCQSQLRIRDEVILQRGVYGRNLTGEVWLQEGWYPISLRFGTGSTACQVRMPDGQKMDIKAGHLSRPATVSILPNGKAHKMNLYELYGPTPVNLGFEPDPTAEIRYTLDGSIPQANSALYKGNLEMSKDCSLTTAAFKAGKLVSAPSTMVFKRVELPQYGSLGRTSFDKWDGTQRQFVSGADYQIWIAPEARLIEGMEGKALEVLKKEASTLYVDINVSRSGGPRAGFKVHKMQLRENAITVALWFKTYENSGKIFGKEGINAFGKSYRTVGLSINNKRLQATPTRLSGGTIEPGVWNFVVLSMDETASALYLNGQLIASGLGSKDIQTDALDFFTGHHAAVQNVQLFDRMLESGEVKRLFDAGKK
jgi:hypothetical protein